MDWIILLAFGASVLWMNGKFNDIRIDIAALKKEMAMIKEVLFLKIIICSEICKNKEIEKK
jgi:hypothetical protein